MDPILNLVLTVRYPPDEPVQSQRGLLSSGYTPGPLPRPPLSNDRCGRIYCASTSLIPMVSGFFWSLHRSASPRRMRFFAPTSTRPLTSHLTGVGPSPMRPPFVFPDDRTTSLHSRFRSKRGSYSTCQDHQNHPPFISWSTPPFFFFLLICRRHPFPTPAV